MNIELRPIELSDAADLAANLGQSAISRFFETPFPSPMPVEQSRAFIENILASNSTAQAWVIQADAAHGGTILVHFGSGVYEKNATIGYYVPPSLWGRGVMSAALKLFSCEIFRQKPDLERLEALVTAENVGSCRALEKAGFTREGVLRHKACKNGVFLDLISFSLLREDNKK